ncbi:MAG: hypothetical protein ACXW35_04540 [Nitrospira sp.]
MIRPRRDRTPRDLVFGRLRHRPVTAQAPCGLEAPALVQLSVREPGTVQIGGLRGPHPKASVVDRQIALQKPIRRLQRRDLCEPQLPNPDNSRLVT